MKPGEEGLREFTVYPHIHRVDFCSVGARTPEEARDLVYERPQDYICISDPDNENPVDRLNWAVRDEQEGEMLLPADETVNDVIGAFGGVGFAELVQFIKQYAGAGAFREFMEGQRVPVTKRAA